MSSSDYELIIVGGGPAGLTAGLYAARARIRAVLLETGAVGGQVLLSEWIDNYPGFPEGISGFELIDRMAAQAKRFGLETRTVAVTAIDLSGSTKKVSLEDGQVLTAQTLILAAGARPNPLGVPGEREMIGKGVSFCATCDGPFYRGLEVAVIGGVDTAVQEAVHLTKFASKVTIIHRRETLRATRILQEQAFANERVHFLWNTTVIAIEGKTGVEGLLLRNTVGQESRLTVQGVFVLIGTIPNNEMLSADQIALDNGFVVTDAEMRTSVPGVMAVGDLRSKGVRQVVTAAGDGAVAALSVEHYLSFLA
ncbi:MAG: thioredoxin-disulfide reductase [Deltaproteobacteria bacterium RIFOXYD12_FULL_50_9]|nr:MAG: thioredoxin-disulfide reductase [Deltaproteobacteria bacterium RIFOXYD12_FULL_50_9]